jgi:hypothetical protein
LSLHKIVNERKLQYTSTDSRNEKCRIAREVIAVVHSAGGRFPKQEDPDDPYYNDNWCEINRSVSEEKVKQALRDKQHYSTNAAGAGMTRKREGDEHAASSFISLNNVMNQHPDLPSQASLPAAAMNPAAGLSSTATTFSSGRFAQEAVPYLWTRVSYCFKTILLP